MAINKEYNDVQLDVNFTQASTRANLVSEENISVSFGKLAKWYAALVPSGGSSGQFLGWNSDGTAKWVSNPNSDTKVTDTVGTANTYYPAGLTGTSTATGTQVFDTSFKFIGTTGTTSAVGKAQLVLGNSTVSGTANNKQGSLVVYGSTAYAHTIQGAPTAARTLTLPDKTGTFALTSDIPTIPPIPTVNDAALTLKGAGTTVTTFTANASSPKSLDIVAGSNVTVTADATNSKISIASSHPTITKSTDTTSTASPRHGGTFTVVDSVTRETNGHVTKINTKTITLPADSNTDTLMTQTNTTTSADYRVLLSGNANDTTETTTGRKSTNLKFNPSSGGLYSFGFLWTDITGRTLDINTLTLSNGTLHSRRFIEKTDGGAANITNIPVTGHPFLLEVDLIRWGSTTDYITRQRFTNAANGTYSYVRYCTNGTWGSWTTRKYTDTDTKVTSSANHYTPATASGQDKTASASGATAAWSIDVVKGVTLNTDGKGHVTGISVTSGKIPANPVPSNNVTGSGTSGYLVKWNGTNTITNGPQLGSSTTTYLRNDGTWATPTGTTYSAGDHLSLSSNTFSVASYAKNLNGGDWNSVVANGWYMGSSCTNAPSTAWWIGHVTAHNNKYCIQELWAFNDTPPDTANPDAMFMGHKMRWFRNSTWGPWVDVSTPTPSAKVNCDFSTVASRTTNVTRGWMAYWDGSYNGSSSNLTYCNQGAFGTIVTKNTGDYVPNTQVGVNNAINLLSTGNATPGLTDYYVSQYANGGTTTTSYHRRPISAMWNAFKGLITLATTGSGNAVTSVSIANDGDYNRKITVTKGSTFSLSSHTHDNYLGAVKIGSYYGMAWPDGTDKGNNSWIRTTRLGLIPYAANTDTTDGNVSALGTSTWTFAAGHIDNLYYKDLKTITVVAGSTADNAIDKMAGSYFFSGSGLFGGINDWVGIQAGYGSDKFQLVANGTAGVLYRHNDTGGTNTTSWTEIKNLMTPEAVFGQNGITVTKKTNTFGTGDTALTYDAGVNIGHSNSVTEVTNYNKPYVKYDAQGHITGSSYWTATAAGTGGESGWIKVATIVHTANYDNTPIMLLVSQRGNTVTYKLHIVWKNVSNTDPNLDKFYLVSDESTSAEAYIIKTATSTWDLYIKKIDSYEAVAMHLYGGKCFDDHMRWTWTDVQTAASAITGGTEATKKVFYDSQLSRTANTVLAAPNGSNGTASFRKLVAADIPSLDYSKVSISRNLTSGTKVGTITIDGTATDLYCQTNTNTTYSAGAHLSLSSTTFSIASYCESITDWNDATTNGWYMGSSVTNAPSTAWWFGRVVAHNAKYCLQEVWQFTASTDGHKVPHKMRMFVNSVWGDWVDITVGKQVPENALFTDTNVTQTVTSSTHTNYRPLLIGNSSSATIGFTPSTNTGGAYASAEIYCQPSSGKVYASEFITNTYPSDSGSSLSQYGLYLKSYKKASLPAGGDYSYSRYAVRTYSGKSADNNGMILTMDSGGLTIVGGGESASALAALISDDQKDSNTSRTRLNVGGTLKTDFHGSSEQLILSSDNNMYFLTNCNTIANRKPVVLDTNSYFYPGTTKTGSIGTSSYMWNSVYAATVYENGKSLGSKYGLNNQIYGLNLTSDEATFNGAETLITSLPSSSGTSEPSYQRVTLKNFIKKVTGDIKEPVLYNNTTNPTQSATVTFDTNLGTPKYLKLFITVVSSSSYSAGGVTNVVDIDPLQYENGCFVGHGSPGQYGVSTYLTYICILHSSPSTGKHTYNCLKSGSMSLSAGNDPLAINASVYITKVIAVY